MQDSQLGLGQQPTLVHSQSGLRAEGIGKSFDKRRVVRNVSIQLNRGEAVGLLGPNGAGKTTTFYMLAGLIPADEGSVYIDGENVTGLPIFQRARLGMGYLPQESSIFRGLTVEQNISAVLETLDIVDRAYIIHDGAMLMQGTPDEVVQHSGVRQVYLGDRFSI